jgi:hypothetical protein
MIAMLLIIMMIAAVLNGVWCRATADRNVRALHDNDDAYMTVMMMSISSYHNHIIVIPSCHHIIIHHSPCSSRERRGISGRHCPLLVRSNMLTVWNANGKCQTINVISSYYYNTLKLLGTPDNTQQTTHNTQHTTHNTQHITNNTQHTTHNTQHITHNT